MGNRSIVCTVNGKRVPGYQVYFNEQENGFVGGLRATCNDRIPEVEGIVCELPTAAEASMQ